MKTLKYELDTRGAADFLGLEEQDMYDYIAEGGGPHFMRTLGGQPIYRGSQLIEWQKKIYAEYLKKHYIENPIP